MSIYENTGGNHPRLKILLFIPYKKFIFKSLQSFCSESFGDKYMKFECKFWLKNFKYTLICNLRYGFIGKVLLAGRIAIEIYSILVKQEK